MGGHHLLVVLHLVLLVRLCVWAGEGPWVELKGWLRACCHCQGPWSGHPRAHRLAVSPCFPCPLLDIWPLALLYRPLDFCSHTSESD